MTNCYYIAVRIASVCREIAKKIHYDRSKFVEQSGAMKERINANPSLRQQLKDIWEGKPNPYYYRKKGDN